MWWFSLLHSSFEYCSMLDVLLMRFCHRPSKWNKQKKKSLSLQICEVVNTRQPSETFSWKYQNIVEYNGTTSLPFTSKIWFGNVCRRCPTMRLMEALPGGGERGSWHGGCVVIFLEELDVFQYLTDIAPYNVLKLNKKITKGDKIPLKWVAQTPCEARFAAFVPGFHHHKNHHDHHHHFWSSQCDHHHDHHHRHHHHHHHHQVWARHVDIAFVEKESGFVDLEIRWNYITNEINDFVDDFCVGVINLIVLTDGNPDGTLTANLLMGEEELSRMLIFPTRWSDQSSLPTMGRVWPSRLELSWAIN